MAAIPGHIRDEVVVVGCHRDGMFLFYPDTFTQKLTNIPAWVLGAADPTSGTVSLHEIVRGFGALLRKGWKPLRTGAHLSLALLRISPTYLTIVVFASWDAEEV